MNFDVYEDAKIIRGLELAYGRLRNKVMLSHGKMKKPNIFRRFRRWYNRPGWNRNVKDIFK